MSKKKELFWNVSVRHSTYLHLSFESIIINRSRISQRWININDHRSISGLALNSGLLCSFDRSSQSYKLPFSSVTTARQKLIASARFSSAAIQYITPAKVGSRFKAAVVRRGALKMYCRLNLENRLRKLNESSKTQTIYQKT